MILRSLPVALWCALVATLATTSAGTLGDDDCALYLSGPGRTSAYDYTLNLLRGNVGYEGQQTCITYDAINHAYIEARKRILVAQPKGDWKPEDYASVGELVLDISINLARTYGLTYEEIEKGLPLVDTSRTLISEVCPPVFSHVECRAGKYRRLDGLCNNLENPTWGSTNVPFQRLIGPLFADGINAPRVSHSGRDLPLSRVVSRTMHPDEGYHDHAGTIMIIAWGQFMDHDYTLTATPLDPRNRNDPEECCNRPPHQKHPYCNEIRIPDDDYFYRLFGVKCMDFVRAFPAVRPGCKLGSRVPFNTLTGAIDGNTVYGVTDKFARKLRTGFGGLLRMNDVFKEYGLKDLLPLKLDVPDEGCTRPNKNMYCFEGGEIRVNEQLVLTVMHTLMAREHNRVAKGLAHVNPHWDDETLYQEARRIVIAEIQHITYNEFLPIFLGKDVMEKFGLILEKRGYWNGYDPQVNPDVIDAFSAAAFRVGHTFLPTAVERWSKAHKFIASKRLSDLIRRPYDLYRAGVLDEYVMGLMNQVAQAMDDSITQEVTNHLFKKVGARFGMDLVSFNMQRGREFGVPGYMEFRKFCGLPGANTFQELFGSMPNETVRRYETIFEHPIDVDLWSGGVSERPLPGSMLGPTFACIIATQFAYSRRGDRFWYELPNQPSSFTLDQLTELRKARMSRIICDNTDIIDTVQLYPMVLPDHELNPRVPCRSGIIPSMDFSKWAEPPPLVGAKQFITDAIIHNNKTVDGTNQDGCEEVDTTTLTTIDANINIDENNTNCTTENDTTDTNADNTNNTIINNADTVLKYVYKKHEHDKTLNKKSSNLLNALRKKRSLSNVQEHEKQPLIVNYETGHPKSIEDTTPELFLNYKTFPPTGQLGSQLLPKQTNSFIKSSELASFDIQTDHGNPLPNNGHIQLPNKDGNREYIRNNNQYYLGEPIYPVNYNNDISEERLDKTNRNIGTYGPAYNKFHPKNPDIGSTNQHQQRNQHRHEPAKEIIIPFNELNSKEEQTKAQNDETSQEDTSEKENYETNNNPVDKPRPEKIQHNSNENDNDSDSPANNSNESAEVYDDSSKYRDSDEKTSNHPDSKETESYKTSDKDSGEGRSYESNYSPLSNNYKESNDEPTEHSHEINSYEKKYSAPQTTKTDDHYSNENSAEVLENSEEDHKQALKLEPKDHNEHSKSSEIKQHVDPSDFSYERIKLTKDGKVVVDKENNDAHEPKYKKTINDTNTSSEKLSDYTYHKKTNKGEIRPVIEINNESNESTKELDSQEKIQSSLQADSIETLDEENLSENHGAIEHKPNDLESVKNYFERIPSNYSHNNDEENVNKNSKVEAEDGPQNAGPEQINNEDDTPFIIPENHIPYDEHLYYKFDDPSIVLPEIKFPEDIIAYNYEEPYYKRKLKEKNKNNRHVNENEIEGKRNRNSKLNYRDYDSDNDDDSEDKSEQKQAIEEDDREYPEDEDRAALNDKRAPVDEEQESADDDRDTSGEDDSHYNDDRKSNQKEDDDSNHPKNFRDNKDTNPEEYEEEDDGGEEERQEKFYENSPLENPDEDHNEDLYEKFVRERFGKRDTFETRAARLEQDRLHTVDPKLRQNLGKILERAGNTQKEAAKSGDPNAGYLWALEYGGNL